MTYAELRIAISAPDLTKDQVFSLLKRVSVFVNDRDTLAMGRDLVIRFLARRELFGKFEIRILNSMVRTVGLYPYMSDTLEMSDNDDRIAYELHRPDNMPEVFHSLQAKIYYQLRTGSNVVLSASTSVGKSLVVDSMIALGKFKKVVIVVPTLALIDETRKRLARRFKASCHLVTHPSQVADSEKPNIYILTQERVRHRIDLSNVDFFVLDEFYKLDFKRDADKQRAIDLNLAFHALASTGAQFYMLGPNVEAIRGLDRYEFHFIPSEYSTVAVDVVHFNLPSRGDERGEKLMELCQSLSSPTLIYCQSPSSAARLAERLLKEVMKKPVAECAAATEWLAEHFHPDWMAAKALKFGVGLHHGGVPRAIQQLMVRLFDEGTIKFLICTSTLIEGVNTAAENVIVYDRRKNRNVLDFFTYKNIQGRAGRMGRYFIGKVFVLEKAPDGADVVVDYPVGSQDADTPLSLIMQLDDEALTEQSRERVVAALKDSFLSENTIRLNGAVGPNVQNKLATEMWKIMQVQHDLFAWRNIPRQFELIACCRLIMDRLSGARLNDLGITSPEQLAWHLRGIGGNGGIAGYLSAIAVGTLPHQDVSERIDGALKIIRNVAGFRFPQDLMVLSRIQLELARRLEVAAGDFSFYAEEVENLFLPGTLAALDEYGLPHPIAKKLSSALAPHFDFDAVLMALRNLHTGSVETLTPFERNLVSFVQSSL